MTGAILGGLGAAALFAVTIYNKLVSLRNGYKGAFANVDVQLKRRFDLIPNLVETAKGYMKHERETLDAVVQARAGAMSASAAAKANPGDPSAMKELATASATLQGAMTKFMAVAEAYPDLKANETMNTLMADLKDTENLIAGSRQTFNSAVGAYNTAREMFPNNLIAGIFSFTPAEFMQSTSSDAERSAVKVAF